MTKEKKYPDIKGKVGTYPYNGFTEDVIKCRTTAIVGTTGSGKSFILNEILTSCKDVFKCCSVLSGTADADDYFPMDGYSSRCLIRDKLDIPWLNRVFNEVEKNWTIYKRARSLPVLRDGLRLLNHIYVSRGDKKMLSRLKLYSHTLGLWEKKLKRMDKNEVAKHEYKGCEKTLINLYRYVMAEGNMYIEKNEVCLDEYKNEALLPIRMVRFNPYVLIVINDLGDEIKNLTGKEKLVFEQICNKGRHFGLTLIILLQNLIQAPKSIRGSFHNYIFTTNAAVEEYLEVDKSMRKPLRDALDCIVNPDQSVPESKKKYYRILFSRLTGKIYYTHSDAHGKQYRVGNKKLLKVLDHISADPLDKFDL